MKKARGHRTSAIPVTSRHSELPLLDHNFSWEQFEVFCRDLIHHVAHVTRVYQYGGKGSAQRGIDFVAEFDNGHRWTFQCRRVVQFSKKQFERTVEKNDLEAEEHIVLVACQVGTPVRDAEAALSDWEVWDVTDVSRLVRKLNAQDQRNLLDQHFGAHVREAFTGRRGPAAFRTWEDHFLPYVTRGLLFHHRLELVGRDTALLELHDFASRPESVVGLLLGRGGIGKTKLLHEFGSRHLRDHPDRFLLFADEGTPFTKESLDDIPLAEGTLVVDDAHRRTDLPDLLAMVGRMPERIKLVLVSRPEARDRLAASLASSPIDSTQVIWFPELKELSMPESISLAVAAIGKDNAGLAERLAAVTWDSPLVTVVGAQLLATKALPPGLLERDKDFRRAVLDRFQDAALGQLGGRLDSGLARRLLEIISALQPVRPEDDGFLEQTSQMLGVAPFEVAGAISELEDASLLLRRGWRVRIVPDVLADYILANACLTKAGASTGFVDTLMERFASLAFDRLLSNVGELDWRMRATDGRETRLLDRAWELLRAVFDGASNTVRVRLLEVVKPGAVYQPLRILDLVESAISWPATAPEPEMPEIFIADHSAVLDKLPHLLEQCAAAGHVQRATRLLWQLGRDDPRPMNTYPDHGVRVLRELAGYSADKPVAVCEQVLATMEDILHEPDALDHVHSPLEVLEPLLSKEGMDHVSQGLAVSLRPFAISPEATRQLRRRVLQLVKTLALGGALSVQLRATDTLEGALRKPIGMVGRVPTKEEIKGWAADDLEALAVLSEVLNTSSEPLLRIKVRDAVAWVAQYGASAEVQQAARSIRDGVVDETEIRIFRTLTEPWTHESYLDGINDFDKAERARKANLERAADDLAELAGNATGLVDELDHRLKACGVAGIKVQPGELVWLIAQRHPQLALDAAALIAEVPGHVLEFLLAQLLGGAETTSAPRSNEIAKRVVDHGSVVAVRAVASLFAYGDWSASPDRTRLALLRRLLRSDDSFVRALAASALERVENLKPEVVRRLLLGVRMRGDSQVAEAVAGVVGSHQSPIFDGMTTGELDKVLGDLEGLSNLEGYQVRMLLARIAPLRPLELTRMLIRRVDTARTQGYATFEAVPHPLAGSPTWGGLSSDQREAVLREVREASLDKSWSREFTLPDLYADIANGWGHEAVSLLEDWLVDRDLNRVRAASKLVGKVPWDYILDHPAFASGVIEAAVRHSRAHLQIVCSGLASSTLHGVRSGTPLQPMPRDLALRGRARTLAGNYPSGSESRLFYEALAGDADRMIEDDRKRDEEMFDGPLP